MNRWKNLKVLVAAAGLIGVGAVPLASAPPRQTPPPATAAVPAKAPVKDPSKEKTGPVTLTLKKDTVIGIRLDQEVSSETARVDDKISAKVSRDVIVDGTTAIPAGARLEGMIVMVERPTETNPRGKLGVQFTALVRPDNSRVALSTDRISREAVDPTGALLDTNAFSTVVGGAARVPPPGRSGAGSPTPTPTPRRDVRLLAGTPLTVHLTAPLSITIARDPE